MVCCRLALSSFLGVRQRLRVDLLAPLWSLLGSSPVALPEIDELAGSAYLRHHLRVSLALLQSFVGSTPVDVSDWDELAGSASANAKCLSLTSWWQFFRCTHFRSRQKIQSRACAEG